jgi:hypothetical protein
LTDFAATSFDADDGYFIIFAIFAAALRRIFEAFARSCRRLMPLYAFNSQRRCCRYVYAASAAATA